MPAPPCLFCLRRIYANSKAVTCDNCHRWHHIRCGNTGISSEMYDAAVLNGQELQFTCRRCIDMNVDENGDVTEEQLEVTLNYSETDSSVSPAVVTRVSEEEETTMEVGSLDTTTFSDTGDMEMDASAILTASFDISHRNTDDPQPITEESRVANPDDTVIEETAEETFTILEGASQRKKPLLVTSTGYSYGIKRKNKASVQWRCTNRLQGAHCPATVMQHGTEFIHGRNKHTHASVPNRVSRATIYRDVRTAAQERLTEAGLEVVESVLVQQTTTANIPGKQLLKRVANRNRAKLRPAEPKDLSFEIDQTFLKCEDFVIADIGLEGTRHIVLASEEQLETLRRAKRWFIDGTFKIVGQPFQRGQLMSIHAFVQEGEQSQQFPLVFALMSRRTTADYVAVLSAVRERLGAVSVEGFVLDFEQAAWNAVREVFGHDVEIRGCVFHWSQAVYRQVQDKGLTATYNAKKNTHNYLRQLMALPFLPASHIVPTFRELQSRPSAPQIQAFCSYIDNQWISNPAFPVSSWSVFRQSVRTNNDVEGWHHRIDHK